MLEKDPQIYIYKKIRFLSSSEPSETFRFGDGTWAALVDMSRTRIGSRQNGVAGWTASRVVRAAPQRRSVAQDAQATAHHRRHYHETATDHWRYNIFMYRYVFLFMLRWHPLRRWRCGMKWFTLATCRYLSR